MQTFLDLVYVFSHAVTFILYDVFILIMSRSVKITLEFPKGSQSHLISENLAMEFLKLILMDDSVTSTKTTPSKKLDIPDVEELVGFLEELEYHYNIEQVTDKFLPNHSHIDDSIVKTWVNAVRAKLARIRKKMELEYNGKWVIEKNGLYNTYKFTKNKDELNEDNK